MAKPKRYSGKELRSRRIGLKLTQVELGRQLGMNGNSIARLERGEHQPRNPLLLDAGLELLEQRAAYSRIATATAGE